MIPNNTGLIPAVVHLIDTVLEIKQTAEWPGGPAAEYFHGCVGFSYETAM